MYRTKLHRYYDNIDRSCSGFRDGRKRSLPYAENISIRRHRVWTLESQEHSKGVTFEPRENFVVRARRSNVEFDFGCISKTRYTLKYLRRSVSVAASQKRFSGPQRRQTADNRRADRPSGHNARGRTQTYFEVSWGSLSFFVVN